MNNNKTEKEILTSDPCLKFFHSGANFEGYWNSSQTKLQLEDTIDILTEVYPNHDFLFLFDQSSGHTKMREDGLNINKMNVAYGGNVPQMHLTTIKELGPYPATLSVGQQQSLIFSDEDSGPFWMTPEQKLSKKMT